jgi:hypothetical protein
MNEETRYSLDEAHKEFAKRFNGRVWELLEKQSRSPEEEEEMLLAQSASHYHWRHVGAVVHQQRGHWLFSRIYAVLNRPDEALDHAMTCLTLTESNRDAMKDFDIAYAQEALARAYALKGNEQLAKEHHGKAAGLGEAIADPEDREIFMGDLQSGNWYGIV